MGVESHKLALGNNIIIEPNQSAPQQLALGGGGRKLPPSPIECNPGMENQNCQKDAKTDCTVQIRGKNIVCVVHFQNLT